MRRETRQLSFAEALVRGGKGRARLERIAALLDLDALAAVPDGRPVPVEHEAGFAKRRGKAFFGSRRISPSTRAPASSAGPG